MSGVDARCVDTQGSANAGCTVTQRVSNGTASGGEDTARRPRRMCTDSVAARPPSETSADAYRFFVLALYYTSRTFAESLAGALAFFFCIVL